MAGIVMVVEDQDSARESLCELLHEEGYQVHGAADGTAAIKLIGELDLDLVLTDLKLPGADGLAVLKNIREVSPQTLAILMRAHATVDTAIEALRLGAQDYILKPLFFENVLCKIRRLMEHRSLAWETQMLRRQANEHLAPAEPVGNSPPMREILTMMEKVAQTQTTVLITGESGVGKEVAARTIHFNSPRRDNIFLPINCSAIPDALLESQLFGYTKGAFTGAVTSQEGLFQRAR